MSDAVFIDTSAFHALANSGDVTEHSIALRVAHLLESTRALQITTDYVLDETYTLMRVVLGHRISVAFGHEIQKGGIEIVQVGEDIQGEAWSIFEHYKDKGFSFTDCTSFVVMELGNIETAFTFDRHFQQYGFQTLPSKLKGRRK